MNDREPDSRPDTFNILFVCTGNTCRSPLAEAVARAELGRRGWSHVRVASAGTAAAPGAPASAEAVTVARRRGLDLEPHRSQPLTPELVGWADLVLTMSPTHLALFDGTPEAEKASLLAAFATAEADSPRSVQDPFGGDESIYAQTLMELDELVRLALDRLTPIISP